MNTVYAVDDEIIFRKIIDQSLKSNGYEVKTFASAGEALEAARLTPPDLVITDVMMPEMDGYSLTRQFRKIDHLAQIPILVLTGQSEIEEKLKAFEAGADDHMTKPFEPAELVARLSVLLRRTQSSPLASANGEADTDPGRVIAVHSLRGGAGCSSLAVNIALGIQGLWNKPTLLFDAAVNVGQIALMLNASLRRTWADLAHYPPEELDDEALRTVISEHDSGLHFISAPTSPVDAETLQGSQLAAMIELLRSRYEYLVFDLPHNFGDIALPVLDRSDLILSVLVPEMASLRAAHAALRTYEQLEYPEEKTKMVLNWTFKRNGIMKEQIEAALHRKISLSVPNAPDRFIRAINMGSPLIESEVANPIAGRLEDYSYFISKTEHKKHNNGFTTPALERVQKRRRKASS
jgi:pilus assembly protein CpaE